MKKHLFAIISMLIAAALVLSGCAAKEPETTDGAFDYSSALDENGHFKGYRALDFVTLPEYKGVTVPDSVFEPDEAEVQKQIDYLCEQSAETTEITDRAVADGDSVNIDYVGKVDGVAFDGGDTHGQGTTVIIGVTQYIDDFLEQLIGHKPGETFDVEVTFPESYPQNTDLQNKDAVFTVTINYIAETSPAEFNDDLAASFGYTSADELRAAINDWVIDRQKTSFAEAIIIGADCKTLPEDVIKYITDSVVAEFDVYASVYGYDRDTMLSYSGYSSTDDFIVKNAANIEASAHDYFVIQAIAEQEGITVSDEFVTENTDEEQIATYGVPYMKMYYLHDFVLDFIYDNAA